MRETPIRVPGFRFAGVACGIKGGGKLDLALMHSDVPATVAAMFTRNRVKAAPVVIAARHTRRGRAQAVLINSGNANACTGAAGARVAIAACRQTSIALGISPYDVIPCSTGKIGVLLPAVPMVRGIAAAVRALDARGLWRAAHAMRTTDAFPKVAVRRVRVGGRAVTIAGLAKGAGMIAPDLATLLVCALTDARVAAPVLRRLVREAVATSFNAITVDGDMSTNDTVVALAPERLRVAIAGIPVLRRGEPAPDAAVRRAAGAMRRVSFTVSIDLGSGRATATVTTSDLTPAYVRFNSAYST